MFPAPQRKGSCKPCRERKVKCDEKKPRCSECISSNKICGGYDLGNIFINMNSSGPPPVWTRSRNAQKYLVVDLASQPSTSQQSQRTGPQIPSSTVLSMARDPNNIRDMIDLFLDLYYRRFGPDKTSPDSLQPGSECGGWRALLPLWIGQSTLLDTAIRALATCFVGSQYQDEPLIHQGTDTYLNALQLMQQVLSEPNSAHRKDLLATTLVMSSIEVFLSNGGGASHLTHIEGANKLLYCMIEEAQSVQDFEELHVYVLNQALIECISTRRPFPFSSSAHRPLIQSLYSSTPSFRGNLYFQWCQSTMPLPGILSATDSISMATTGSATTNPSAILAVLDELSLLEHALLSWHEVFKTNTPGPWTFPAAQISADSVPFPLQFVSIEACTLHCLHWASQLLILDVRNTLISYLPANDASQLLVPDLPAKMSEYASLICRSVQFCSQNTSFAATENIFLPLLVVADFYTRQGDQDRKNWCVGAFARIAEEQKIGYAVEKLNLTERAPLSRTGSFGPV